MRNDLTELKIIHDIENQVDQAYAFFVQKKNEALKEKRNRRVARRRLGNSRTNDEERELEKAILDSEEGVFSYNFKQLENKLKDLIQIKNTLIGMKNKRYAEAKKQRNPRR